MNHGRGFFVLGFADRGSGSLLDDSFTVCRDDFLRASVQLGVFDEAVTVRESGAALLTTVGLLTLERNTRLVTSYLFTPFNMMFAVRMT